MVFDRECLTAYAGGAASSPILANNTRAGCAVLSTGFQGDLPSSGNGPKTLTD